LAPDKTLTVLASSPVAAPPGTAPAAAPPATENKK